MVTSSFTLTPSIQLSAQVSECLSLEPLLLHFVRASLARHQAGSDTEYLQELLASGSRVSSVHEFTFPCSLLDGMQLSVITPLARDTTFVSFVGELF